MSIKVIIADDHPLIISGLESIINKYPDIEVISTYNEGKSLLEGLATKRPDVLLLDIHMPGQSGDEIAGIVSKRYPKISILALTNQDNIYYIKSMLQHGVLGYILKNAKEDMLIEAIKTVSSGQQYLDPVIKERIRTDNISINRQTAHGTILTNREKEILKLIYSNYTSQEIAEKLFLSKRTVDSHRLNLLLKLEVKNTGALVKKAIDMGLIE